MTHFRSVLHRRRSSRLAAGVVAVGLGAATLVVATDGAQPRERARPVADIVNPWAAGDAAIQRLLDECIALRGNGSDVDPLAVYLGVIRAKPACEMFRPRRILAALPTADE
jgi:hypothetical protein